MDSNKHAAWILIVIVAVYLIIGTAYAAVTPAWQAPDEPAHYNYIRQLASGTWPVINAGDYDQEYLGKIVSSNFPRELTIETIQYQDYQPPLYYLLQTPVFLLFGGNLPALRIFSLLLGAGILVVVYRIGTLIFPGQPLLSLIPAAFIAFIPQHIAIMASVNNDSLSELLLAIALLGITQLVMSNKDEPKPWLLGLLLGAVFLTKVQAYIAAPLIGLAVIIKWFQKGRDTRRLVRYGLAVVIPALCIGALLWGRNMIVYGGFDIFGLNRHDLVVIGQPTTKAWIAENGLTATLNRFLLFTFQSFWGMFGWMGVPMDSRVYQALLVLSIATAIGMLFFLVSLKTHLSWNNQAIISVLLATSAFLSTSAYIWYNLTYVQHQGRYLFPALVPISLAAATSWKTLTVKRPARITSVILVLLGIGALLVFSKWLAMFFFCIAALLWICTYLPLRFQWILPASFVAFLMLISILCPFWFIVPSLS